MKKRNWLLLLFVSMGLQSCFEIIEEIQMKNDGSGNFQLILNLSKSKTKLNSIMKMETINGHPVPSKQTITAKVQEIESTMKKTPGISNVKTMIDFDNYICTASCNFGSIAQLNKTIRNIKLKEKGTGDALEDSYSYDARAKIFERKNKFALKESYLKMSKADKEIFSAAGYTAIYKFESNIAAISNKDGKISAGKKAVMLTYPALDIITQKRSIENNINLTN